MKKPLLISVSAVGTLVVLYAVLTQFMPSLSGSCGNELVARYPSPDQKQDVIVFERDCGATTGFSTQGSVVTHGASVGNEAGNIFTADSDHGLAPSGPGGGPDFRVMWKSDSRVVVFHHPKARLFRQESVINKVSIEYSLTEEPAQQSYMDSSRK